MKINRVDRRQKPSSISAVACIAGKTYQEKSTGRIFYCAMTPGSGTKHLICLATGDALNVPSIPHSRWFAEVVAEINIIEH